MFHLNKEGLTEQRLVEPFWIAETLENFFINRRRETCAIAKSYYVYAFLCPSNADFEDWMRQPFNKI